MASAPHQSRVDRTFGEYTRTTTTDSDARVHAGNPDPWDASGDSEWAVWLPHDCDAWVIAEGNDPAEVAARVDAMIASLQEARDWMLAQASV